MKVNLKIMENTHTTPPKKKSSKKLFAGMGIGYVICIFTHFIAAMLPMDRIFPFLQQEQIACIHVIQAQQQHSIWDHLLVDLLTIVLLLPFIILLTWAGHKLTHYIKQRKGRDTGCCST